MIVPGNPGVGQAPLATPFQPGKTGIEPAEQQPRQNQTQPAEAAAAESQSSERQTLQSREAENVPVRAEQNDNSEQELTERSADAARGSLVDVEA